MDEALLLRAFERVVGRIEVGNKHTLEVLEQVVQEVPLSRGSVHIQDLLLRRENQDVSCTSAQPHFGLVDMENVTGEDFVKKPLVSWPVVFGHHRLEPPYLRRVHP